MDMRPGVLDQRISQLISELQLLHLHFWPLLSRNDCAGVRKLNRHPSVWIPCCPLGASSPPSIIWESLAGVLEWLPLREPTPRCPHHQYVGALEWGEQGCSWKEAQLDQRQRRRGRQPWRDRCQLPATSEGHLMQLSPLVLPSQWAKQEENSKMGSTKEKGNS